MPPSLRDQVIRSLILAAILTIIGAVGLMRYYSVTRFVCDGGFKVTFPLPTMARIQCHTPDITLQCDARTYVLADYTASCTSSEEREYEVLDRAGRRDAACRESMGSHSAFINGECACEHGYERISRGCVHRDLGCKHIGPEGVAVFQNDQWTCGCERGFDLFGDPPFCTPIDDICVAVFGSGSEGAPLGQRQCVCKAGFTWNDDGSKCV